MTHAVLVEGLAKRYHLGRSKGGTLRDALAGWRERKGENSSIWALREVSFQANPGERIGIIGRNGAGKSTLLKILARITKPTAGRATLRGRVASLLEVGTGFHPDLTGRENIFLNGAILGMSRAEVRASFDGIVAFAEIDRFLDVPVKRYSSGMQMRLAFSVACHLECDVLLIDEVLAVGDAAFQKKCLGAMRRMADQGRTLLFVTHDLAALRSHTNKCLYLRDGSPLAFEDTKDAIGRYYRDTLASEETTGTAFSSFRRGDVTGSPVVITDVVVNGASTRSPVLALLEPLELQIEVTVERELEGASVTVIIKREDAVRVAMLFSGDEGQTIDLEPGKNVVSVRLPRCTLSPGRYFCDIGINPSTGGTAYDAILDYPFCEVAPSPVVPDWPQRQWGAVHLPEASWACDRRTLEQ
jgi:lipopolysaccharide transport system ATP-binding protein